MPLKNFKNRANRIFYFFPPLQERACAQSRSVFSLFSQKRLWASLILAFFLFSFISQKSLASFSYVLPYPSFMPGHKLYRVEQIFDSLLRFWAFGNFSRHKYELGMADKKLVEAKTLFEYGQYFLATQTLADSNQHWRKAENYLKRARDEGKDVSQKLANFLAAAEKHKEVLEELLDKLPEEVIWQEERKEAQKLKIRELLEEAMRDRKLTIEVLPF